MFCNSRINLVQAIQTSAFADIEFYSEKVAEKLSQQKTLHLTINTDSLINSVMHEFAEYQLACYINSYCSFLDIMLRRDFSTESIENAINKLSSISARYQELYAKCHSQIAHYQRTAIENKIIGGLGIATTNIGKAVGTIPVIKKGSIDEALISAGQSMKSRNRNVVAEKLNYIDKFEDDRTGVFIDNLKKVECMFNIENALVTDGDNLFLFSP